MDISSIIDNVKDIFTIIFYVGGTYIAYSGLSAWKKQLKGNQAYDLSKNLLTSIYKYRDALYATRNPAVFQYEYPPGLKDADIEHKDMLDTDYLKPAHQLKELKRTEYVYENRWKKVMTAKTSLYELSVESQVLWGKNVSDFLSELYQLENELRICLMNHIKSYNPEIDFRCKVDFELLYDNLTEDDSFRKHVDSVVSNLEEYLKKYLVL